MNDNVAPTVLEFIHDISAPMGIRSITPGFVAGELKLDLRNVFEAMVKMTEIGLLGQRLQVMCPFCSSMLNTPLIEVGTPVTCEACDNELVVSDENIYVSFSSTNIAPPSNGSIVGSMCRLALNSIPFEDCKKCRCAVEWL